MKLLLIKTSELNGELQRNQQKRFSLPCEGRNKKIKKNAKKINKGSNYALRDIGLCVFPWLSLNRHAPSNLLYIPCWRHHFWWRK